METFKTTVSGLAETQMSSMGSYSSPAPASNLRLIGSGRLNALLKYHHLRCLWVIKRPFSSSISKQNLTPGPTFKSKRHSSQRAVTPPNELSTCPEPEAWQVKLASERAGFKSQYQVPLCWAPSVTLGRNVWQQEWGVVPTAIQSSVYSWPSWPQSLNCDTKAHCLTIPSTYLLLSLKADVSELIRNRVWVIQGNWNVPSLPLTAVLKFWSNHCRTATYHPADLGWIHFYGFQPASATPNLSKVHRLLPVLKPLKFIKIISFDICPGNKVYLSSQ